MSEKKSIPPFRHRLLRAAGIVVLIVCLFLAILQSLMVANRIPADLLTIPEALRKGMNEATPTRSAQTAAAAVRWDKPEPPKNLDEYLAFRQQNDPNDSATSLTLEFLRRFQDGKTGIAFLTAFTGPGKNESWKTGVPLSEDQKRWLLEHRELAGFLQRMIEAGGPILMTRDEIQSFTGANLFAFPVPSFLMNQTGAKILAAEAQRRMDAGESAGFAPLIGDLQVWGNRMHDQLLIGSLVGIAIQQIGNRELAAWIESGRGLPPGAEGLQASLAANALTRGDQRFGFGTEFGASRKYGVELVNGPILRLVKSNYQRLTPGAFEFDVDQVDLLGGLRRDPGKLGISAATAIGYKLNAVQSVRERDAYCEQMMGAIDKPYGELPDEAKLVEGWSKPNFFAVTTPHMKEFFIQAARGETATRLNLAALDLLQNGPPPAITPGGAHWSESPWRDPFTEQPLQVVPDADRTLIYSLGPDLRDQHGAIAYDPTNGTVSAGDIALRVPHAKP